MSRTPSRTPPAEKTIPQSWALGIIMFSMGACGLAYEYTFSKIASDLLGNSVRQWAIIIAIMLFMMGLGADLQKHIQNKRLADKLIWSQILLGILGAFGPFAMIYAYAWYPGHFAVVQYGFTALTGLLIGFEIPLVLRLSEGSSGDVKHSIARILKMDYLGALIGALLWVFLLIKIFTITEIAFILGLTTFATAGFTIYLFRLTLQYRGALIMGLMVAVIASSIGLTQVSEWALSAEQALYRDKIIFAHTTQYQHIVLTEGQHDRINCYINGNLQFSSNDEFIYHENLVHPVMTLSPRRDRVLILGGGDGLALREVLKYPDVKEVVLVDIDPEMTRLARENPHISELNEHSLSDKRVNLVRNKPFDSNKKTNISIHGKGLRYHSEVSQKVNVSVLNMDAATYVQQAAGRFNVIIMDFPDPNSPDLAKLYSHPFYEAMKDKLTADGLYVQQSTSPIHAKEAFLCIGRTLKEADLSAVPYHDNVPSFGEWGWWIGGHSNLYSEQKLLKLVGNNDALIDKTKYLTPDLMQSAFIFGKDQLHSNENAITTLTSPQIYQYYLEAWENDL